MASWGQLPSSHLTPFSLGQQLSSVYLTPTFSLLRQNSCVLGDLTSPPFFQIFLQIWVASPVCWKMCLTWFRLRIWVLTYVDTVDEWNAYNWKWSKQKAKGYMVAKEYKYVYIWADVSTWVNNKWALCILVDYLDILVSVFIQLLCSLKLQMASVFGIYILGFMDSCKLQMILYAHMVILLIMLNLYK